MKKPDLSIIVPVYDCQEFIEDCIDSVINQSYGFNNLELILVDDLSPCRASEIIESKYLSKHKNIQLIKNTEKGGPGGSRNKGVKEASSDLITFIDGDDWYHLDFCSKMIEAHADNNSDITVCGMINTVDGETKRWGNLPPDGVFKKQDKINLLWSVQVECHSPYRIYNKSLFESNNIWFKPNAYYEDTAIMPHLFSAANSIATVPLELYYYRYNPKSIVNTSSNKHILDINDSIRYLLENIPINKQAVGFIWRVYNHNLFQKRWEFVKNLPPTDLKLFLDGFLSNLIDYPFLVFLSDRFDTRQAISEKIKALDESYSTRYFEKLKDISKRQKSSNPLVSVIMTNFNNSKQIRESILSVLNQDYDNLELIIIDDHSTDDSITEISKIKDDRIKLIQLSKNRRTYFARNVGIQHSSGEIVTNVDSDDIIHRSRIGRVVAEFGLDSNLKLIETRFIRYHAENSSLEPRIFTQGVGEGFYKKEVFQKLGFFLPIRIGGDSELSDRTAAYFGIHSTKIVNDFTYFAKILPTTLTAIDPQGSDPRREFIKYYTNLHTEDLNKLKVDFPWSKDLGMDLLASYSYSEKDENLKVTTVVTNHEKEIDEEFSALDKLCDLLLIDSASYYYGQYEELRKERIPETGGTEVRKEELGLQIKSQDGKDSARTNDKGKSKKKRPKWKRKIQRFLKKTKK